MKVVIATSKQCIFILIIVIDFISRGHHAVPKRTLLLKLFNFTLGYFYD